MKVTILGSGTATPQLLRNASGILLETSEVNVLVDVGPGILRRLCEARFDYKKIDVILTTHFHPDHVSDLVSLLFAHNYAYGVMRTEPFYLVGPRGLEQLYDGLVNIYGSWIVPTGNRLILKELHDEQSDHFHLKAMELIAIPAKHSHPSISVRINDRNKSVTISGDTAYSEDLAMLARNTDVFICECSMPEDFQMPGHSSPSDAGKMAASANARKLVLTHFYPPCDEVDVVSQASNFYSGAIVKSEDLLKIEV